MTGESVAETASSGRARSPELQAQFAEVLAARDDARRVVDLLAEYPDEEDVDALLVGADALITLGLLDHAMEAYREIERLAPGHPGAASGVARIALVRTASSFTAAPAAREPANARAASAAVVQRARVAALAFTAAALGALALAGAHFLASGLVVGAAWALVLTAAAGAVVAVGLERRAPLAWWGGAGFAAGAALVSVLGGALTVLAGSVTLGALALPGVALVVASALAGALWFSRDAARA